MRSRVLGALIAALVTTLVAVAPAAAQAPTDVVGAQGDYEEAPPTDYNEAPQDDAGAAPDDGEGAAPDDGEGAAPDNAGAAPDGSAPASEAPDTLPLTGSEDTLFLFVLGCVMLLAGVTVRRALKPS